jgi:hypothetical protein
MKRPTRLVALAAAIAVLVLGLSLYLHSWGGVALLVVLGGGFTWYHLQVARTEDADPFFGDMGEETRLTGFQGGSPSEMPSLDRTMPPPRPLDPPNP